MRQVRPRLSAIIQLLQYRDAYTHFRYLYHAETIIIGDCIVLSIHVKRFLKSGCQKKQVYLVALAPKKKVHYYIKPRTDRTPGALPLASLPSHLALA